MAAPDRGIQQPARRQRARAPCNGSERCHGRFPDCPDKALLASYYGWVFNQLDVYDE